MGDNGTMHLKITNTLPSIKHFLLFLGLTAYTFSLCSESLLNGKNPHPTYSGKPGQVELNIQFPASPAKNAQTFRSKGHKTALELFEEEAETFRDRLAVGIITVAIIGGFSIYYGAGLNKPSHHFTNSTHAAISYQSPTPMHRFSERFARRLNLSACNRSQTPKNVFLIDRHYYQQRRSTKELKISKRKNIKSFNA